MTTFTRHIRLGNGQRGDQIEVNPGAIKYTAHIERNGVKVDEIQFLDGSSVEVFNSNEDALKTPILYPRA